jgi:hypothetical protein
MTDWEARRVVGYGPEIRACLAEVKAKYDKKRAAGHERHRRGAPINAAVASDLAAQRSPSLSASITVTLDYGDSAGLRCRPHSLITSWRPPSAPGSKQRLRGW